MMLTIICLGAVHILCKAIREGLNRPWWPSGKMYSMIFKWVHIGNKWYHWIHTKNFIKVQYIVIISISLPYIQNIWNLSIFTRCHDAVSVGESNNFPHFWEGGVFHEDEDRSDLVGEHVGVACCGQVFPGQWHNVETGRQLVEETRMAYNQFQKNCFWQI